jgi:hypothetical protein
MQTARRRRNIKSQRGNALIFVTVVGLVITTAFVAFMESTVVVEERAVEAELAKSRAYWAEMGNFNYALSRVSFSQLCNPCGKSKDSALAPVLQAYFDELSNNKLWTYPDDTITTTTTAATAGGQTYSGWLTATSTYTSSALVASSSGKLPQMKLGVCVGLLIQGAKCGGFLNYNGGSTSAYFSINQLANLPQP